MTKHRAVVTGWDPDHVNPDESTGRPKGVQTAIDFRIASTYDVLAAGLFALHGIPEITGSPTNSASISPFMAAIECPNGGYYVVQISDDETFEINMANVGAVKIYVQQQDYEVNNAYIDSEVVIGVVYGATAIPAGSLLLFSSTITAETSTSGLTFVPEFKFTGAASGSVRVPTFDDLENVAVIQNGTRALVTSGSSGEYVYNLSEDTWEPVGITAFLAAMYPIGSVYTNATNNANPATLLGFGTWAAFAAGRVPVGIDSTQTEFDTAGETGGAKTHSHWTSTSSTPSGDQASQVGNANGATRTVSRTFRHYGAGTQYTDNVVEKASAPESSLQPYVVVYMWRRTA